MTKIVERGNPNRHGEIRLRLDDDGTFYLSVPCCRGCDAIELGTDEIAARAAYAAEVAEMMMTPNWGAQARYDADHGTDNGYAPWQFGREY